VVVHYLLSGPVLMCSHGAPLALPGLRAGLLSPEGLVLLMAIGLRSVFGTHFAFEENVLGLFET